MGFDIFGPAGLELVNVFGGVANGFSPVAGISQFLMDDPKPAEQKVAKLAMSMVPVPSFG